MNLSRLLLYILLAFFLYKFVFNFLVPVLKMSWRVRRQIKEFQRQQQQQPPFQQNTSTSGRPSSSSANKAAAPSPKGGEYIDFEEVKD
ncbi:hypothetical protein [Niastella sp. OAS944]|uniref:hypothetical protein n=1 Tax=Niastella sp. OAS944 TaxID=2664089 RepID=UPI0034806C10|nr:hypothetical protein [Chitinophagaceae bacterium OAS944]